MNLCLDAGFLIGLYDKRDQHHERSRAIYSELFESESRHVAVIVWPALYEAVSTRMVRSSNRMIAFEEAWRALASTNRLEFMDDGPYREEALELCLIELNQASGKGYRDLSLTDRVLRAVLADPEVCVDAILTFNEKDFVDVCQKYKRQIVS